jgi:hypothetical protein
LNDLNAIKKIVALVSTGQPAEAATAAPPIQSATVTDELVVIQ